MDLPTLREKLDSIDDQLIGKLYMRLRLSSLVGLIKAKRELPIEDLDRERNVLSRWVKRARLLGLTSELLLDQFNTILNYSKFEQIRHIADRRITIYGYGSMSRVLLKLLSKAGYDIVVCGRDTSRVARIAEEFGVGWLAPHEAIPRSDIVIFTTPPKVTLELSLKYGELYRVGSLVMDVSSVKSGIVDKLMHDLPEYVEYVSIHPLFGDVPNPVGEYVGVLEVRCLRWCGWVPRMLESLGLNVVMFKDPEEHDKYMAIYQVLHHTVLGLLDEAMRKLSEELGIDLEIPMITHSMRYTMKALERFRDLGSVAEEIMELNPHGARVIGLLGDLLAKRLSARPNSASQGSTP